MNFLKYIVNPLRNNNHIVNDRFIIAPKTKNTLKLPPGLFINVSRSLLLFLMVTVSLTGCWFGGEAEPIPTPFVLPSDLLTLPTVADTSVQKYKVERGLVVQEFVFDGTVEASDSQSLYFEYDGRVRQVYVKSGDFVQPGTLIAELDTIDLELQRDLANIALGGAQRRIDRLGQIFRFELDEAQLRLEIEQTQLDALRRNPETNQSSIQIQERRVDLAELAINRIQEGLLSGSMIDSAWAEGDAAFERAQLEVKRAERSLAKAQLTAPFTGTVRFGDDLAEGKLVQSFTPLANIVDTGELIIASNLARSDLEPFYEEMPVAIRFKFRPGVEFTGKIKSLPQPFGNGSGALTLISVDQPPEEITLREGNSMQITAEIARNENALWLPPAAIQRDGNKTFVWVRGGEGLNEQSVIIGLQDDERIEIVSGLYEGQEVFLR